MELGITTFAETTPDPATGRVRSHGDRLRQVVEEAELCEDVGLDVYGIGEHHRPDFASSAPVVVLAAIAARTQRIRLAPAVVILSSDDPVRVFQQFATLDLLSSGRAELLVGRGSFIESFPLFGFDLADYDDLFAEKLDLLLAIRDNERVTWSGKFRSPLVDQAIFPRPEQDPLPIWVGVGGSPESMVRAGERGLPVALAIIGGIPDRFSVLGDIYRRALSEAGFDPAEVPLAVHAHGYVAAKNEQAAEEFYPSYSVVMTQLGRERGWSPMTRMQFEGMRGPVGSLVIGDPETVAEKIVRWAEILGIVRFMLHISVGTLPHHQVLNSIERFGNEVAPLVRKALS
ncbi:MAG: LLM class flavin-dependent oxidoreductase [Acidimicrobiia bacterium]